LGCISDVCARCAFLLFFFQVRIFWQWMAEGAAQGALLFYLMWAVIGGESGSGSEVMWSSTSNSSESHSKPQGRASGLWLNGLQILLAILLLTNMRMSASLRRITVFNLLASLLGLVALLVLLVLFGQSYFINLSPDCFGLLTQLFSSPITYLYCLLAVVAASIPTTAWAAWRSNSAGPDPTSAALTESDSGAATSSPYTAELLYLLDNGCVPNSAFSTTRPSSTSTAATTRGTQPAA
jgi:hypothetical protein